MEKYLLIPLLCCIILIIILFITLNKRTKTLTKVVIEKHDIEVARKEELKDYFKEEWDRQEKHLQDELLHHEKEVKLKRDKLESDFKVSETELNGILRQLESLLKEKEKRYNEVNQDLETYRKGKINEIDSAGAEYEKRKRLEIEQALKQAKLNANSDFNNCVDGYMIQKAQMQSEIEKIKSELEEERTKRAAINEEIRREQLLAKEKDAHRIILSNEDKEDIAFLTTILPKINHKETLYKLIWSEYLIKPYQNMIKQLFGSKVPKNVIYCIESLDGKYKYIGKTSADVSKRWSEHIKTSLNIGGVSRSKVHDALYLHWDEFTFSILEETTKECLSEREKYYINFFESDKYGLNIKSGG